MSKIDKLTEVGREATKYEFSELPNSPDCKNGLKMADEDLLQKILNYDLNYYYSNYLQVRKSFFQIIPYENFFRYSKDPISSPLTRLPSDLNSVALKLYEELMYYMKDKKSKYNSVDHVKKHLKLGINATEDIKDEAYVQVLKQIKDNPDQ